MLWRPTSLNMPVGRDFLYIQQEDSIKWGLPNEISENY